MNSIHDDIMLCVSSIRKQASVKEAAFPTLGRIAYALRQTLRQRRIANHLILSKAHDIDYDRSFVENLKTVLGRANEAKFERGVRAQRDMQYPNMTTADYKRSGLGSLVDR